MQKRKRKIRRELQSALEGWIMVGLHTHGEIPIIDKIDLTVKEEELPDEDVKRAELRSKLAESIGTIDLNISREVRITIEEDKDGCTGTVCGIDGVVVGQGQSAYAALLETVSALKFHLETFAPKKIQPQIGPRIVISGPAIFQGTKISVADVLDELAAGQTIQQVIEKYPDLTEESVRRALRFAAQVLKAKWNRAMAALEEMQEHAVQTGLDRMTDAEIDKEITETRKARRKR